MKEERAGMVVLSAAELVEMMDGVVRKALAANDTLVDKHELAQKLGCCASHVDALRKRGMPTVHVSPKVVRFEPAKCIEWLATHGQSA